MSFSDNRIPTTQYLGYPIIQNHSIQQKAREILKHNKRSNFTRVSMNGTMGSGKTSLIIHLLHLLHELGAAEFGKNYAITWLDSMILTDPEKFAESIKPVDQIIISDDASYVTEMMGKIKKAALKHNVTKTRHKWDKDKNHITFNVIWVNVTHYTKGFDKMLRDADFRFFTTITPEEKRSVAELIGKDYVQKFITRSYMMEIHGKCCIQLDPRDPDDLLWYKDGEPFRLALYSSKFGTHFCVFCDPTLIKTHKLHCNQCNPEYDGRVLSADDFIDAVIDGCSKSNKSTGKKYAYAGIRLMLFNLGFTKYLYRHTFKAYYLALSLYQKYKINPDAIGKALNKRQGKSDSYSTEHRQLNQSVVLQVEQNIANNSDDSEGYDEQ